jgi:hypothetical protein
MRSAGRRVIPVAVRRALLASALLCFSPAAAFAQPSPVLLPNELTLGPGATRDQTPAQWSPSVVAALGWDWDDAQWAVLVVETRRRD